MPLVSLFERTLSNSSSFRQSINNHSTEQSNIVSYPKGNNATKENGGESSFVKHQSPQHQAHAIDRTLIDFSNNHQPNKNSSMSAATAARSPFHPHVVSEESYCSPWDLKTQEEKFKLLSEQRAATSSSSASPPTSTSHTITALTDALLHPSNTNHRSISSSSSINNPFQRTRSARTTSFNKKSFFIQEPPPPELPPLPPGGLVPPPVSLPSISSPCQCVSNSSTRTRTVPNTSASDILDPSLKKISYCLNAHAVRSGTDTSRSFVFSCSSASPSSERSQRVNTAPAKVDLSSVAENRSEPSHIISQSSTTSLLSTTSSSSIESPLITDDTKPMSFEAALQRFKRLSSSTRCNNANNNTNNNNNNPISVSSLPKPQNNPSQESPIAYERPWDTLQTSLINSLSSPPISSPSAIHNRSGDSLQKIPSADESRSICPPPPFPIMSLSPNSCRQSTSSSEERSIHSNTNTGELNKMSNRNFIPISSDLETTIPIDRYFWYHYAMSRRTAENVLQTRPPGSFLVRQSESGNQNDYSLSIRTNRSCMHMRICHSGGVYILGECSRPFPSVSRMIEYFSQTSVPIRGAAPIKLGSPIFRCETLLLSSSPNHPHCNDGNDELL